MLFYRRVFQNFDSNRLRRHQFLSVTQHKTQSCHNINDQFVRTKSDIVTHNNQHLEGDHCTYEIPKHDPFVLEKTLPFAKIPCADQKTNRFGHFQAISHLCKQLLTSKWENRFHEEIDEYHQDLGPIFRKSLGPNQSGEFQSM